MNPVGECMRTSSTTLGLLLLVSLSLWSAGCGTERDRPGDDCRCEGAVPEGHLSAACGEAVCLGGGAGYRCTDMNTAAAAPEACLVPDGGVRPDDDAGPAPDAGGFDAGSTVDAGRGVDAGTSRDAGHTREDAGPTGCTAASCADFVGSYDGTYEIYTAEKLGSTIINEMRCIGTSSLTVDFSEASALSGTVTCTYSGSLGGFDSTQNGTVEGTIRPDGSIAGTLTHQFDTFDSGSRRSFSFTGNVGSGAIAVEDTGSWRPHPMSAVPWDVEISIDASR